MDLYTLTNGFPAKLHHYQNLAAGDIIKTEMRTNFNELRSAALANYKNRFMFVTGGKNYADSNDRLNDTWSLEVSNGNWLRGLDLKQPRAGHSSCSLGN